MILSDELASGERINESDLARRVGVSRTPVRDALQRLALEGYLARPDGRAYVVTRLGPEDIVDVYRVRAVLEGLAAEEATQVITRSELGRLEDLYEAMEDARAEHDDRRLATLNSTFHLTIAEASRNKYLASMLRDIYEVFERFRPVALTQPGRRDSAAEEHGRLIAALKKGDADAAREIAVDHVHRALETRQLAEEHLRARSADARASASRHSPSPASARSTD